MLVQGRATPVKTIREMFRPFSGQASFRVSPQDYTATFVGREWVRNFFPSDVSQVADRFSPRADGTVQVTMPGHNSLAGPVDWFDQIQKRWERIRVSDLSAHCRLVGDEPVNDEESKPPAVIMATLFALIRGFSHVYVDGYPFFAEPDPFAGLTEGHFPSGVHAPFGYCFLQKDSPLELVMMSDQRWERMTSVPTDGRYRLMDGTLEQLTVTVRPVQPEIEITSEILQGGVRTFLEVLDSQNCLVTKPAPDGKFFQITVRPPDFEREIVAMLGALHLSPEGLRLV